ncbi:MAG TPA: MFS transporter [Candidatus Omnitrophota bacterium]|nr:MFS transporter [Candidatus Omnitrophota bacterium]
MEKLITPKSSQMARKTALFTVFLAVLIDLIGFGIVLPLLPYYSSIFNASATQVGFLYSIFSLAQLIFSPLWGSFSDRVGRRPVMLISTFGAVIAYVIFGLAHTLSLLFISRLIAGIMGGNISTAQAYVADVTSHEDRAKGMGLIGAAFGIGFVMGPALASILIHPPFLHLFHIPESNKFAVPGFFAAFLSFASFLLVYFKLPETIHQKNGDTAARPSVLTQKFWQFLKPGESAEKKVFFFLILSAFLFSFAQASLYSAFPIFCEGHLKLTVDQVGILFVYMGVIAIVIQGGLIKPLTARFGEIKLFITGTVLMVAGFILTPFTHSTAPLLFALGIMSVGGSLNGPTLNSLISKEADPSNVGATMGISQGMGSLGRVLGPTLGGAFYEVWYRLPFFVTAALLSFLVWVGIRLKHHAHRKTA